MLKAVSSVANTIGAVNYKGTWNANTNSPALASGVGVKGDYYVVSTAGSTNLDGQTLWGVGDWAVFNGLVWQKVDGGSTGLLTTLTVTGDTSLSTTSGSVAIGAISAAGKFAVVVPNSGALQLAGNFTNNADADFSLSIKSGETWIGPSTSTPLVLSNSGNTERVRIPAAGGMVVGTAAIATNATDGFLYVPTCAGTPTGTPTAQTGTAPIVIDTTNNKLYFYSGGTWRDAGP